VSDDLAVEGSGEQTRRRPDEVRPPRDRAPAGGMALRIYKPGQGYYTRLGTTIGIGVLSVCGSVFLRDELATLDMNAKYLLPVQYGVSFGFLVVMAAVIYWLVGRSRRANDFFIATEGEMKKVRWSTRKEVVKSTKVVIVAVILLGTFLFAADLLFMMFFSTINVLKGSPGLEQIFGGGS
jgi:preprotein translocase SecE subunit